MYRIDNATAISPIPAPAAPGPNPDAFFTKGNPGLGVPATIVDDDWANAVQEEICNVIAGAGITLSKTVRTQMLTAISILAQQATLTRLTGNTTFYVSTTGSDVTGTGTALNPFRTAQKAVNTAINNYHFAGFTVTISRANGNYTDPCIVIGKGVGQTGPIIFAAPGGPPNVQVTSTIGYVYESDLGAAIAVNDQKLINTIGNGLYTSRGSFLSYSNVTFGTISGACVNCDRASVAIQQSPCTVAGNVGSVASADTGSDNEITSQWTLTGVPVLGTAFAITTTFGSVNAVGATFVGTATGPRYSSTLNGLINTNGGGANFFPGNSAGATATQGLYV